MYLIDTADYTFSAAHTNMSQLTAAGRVSSATLASKTVGTVSAGAMDSADVTFTTVTGDQSEALVMLKSTGTESTSPLMIYLDTVASGLPVTPNGGSIGLTIATAGWYTV